MTMLDALVKSMTIFVDNIDLKNGGNAELKSKHFSRALSMIYALQTSLDFEKGGDIANNLFQLYEFSRVKLIDDLSGGVAVGTLQAIDVMSSIRDAWDEMGKQISDEK
jgi:flagellar protein FliS